MEPVTARRVGEVEALFRYPVKSMSGEPLEVADLGWHGLDGDRRRGPAGAGDLLTHVL
jgi:hypothetical protein